MSRVGIVGAGVIPTILSMSGDSKVKAGADAIRARMSEARSAAMEEGRPYRMVVSPDGTRIRVSPDDQDNGQAPPAPSADEERGPLLAEDELPEHVTAHVMVMSEDMGTPAPEGTAWAREGHSFERDIAELTHGQVRMKWYLGGIAGDELQMLDRVRRDQLDGVASAGMLCHRLSPSMRVRLTQEMWMPSPARCAATCTGDNGNSAVLPGVTVSATATGSS